MKKVVTPTSSFICDLDSIHYIFNYTSVSAKGQKKMTASLSLPTVIRFPLISAHLNHHQKEDFYDDRILSKQHFFVTPKKWR